MEILRKLDGYHGAEVYLVGGYVRDLIRRKKNKDVDIVVRKMKPHGIKSFLNRYGTAKFVNLTFGVPVILFKAFGDNKEAQITLPRNTRGNFNQDNKLKHDSECRDYTINAIYLPINYKSRNEIIDFHNGYKDIKKRTIRAVGNPDKRIEESPIRMLRGISLAARTHYRIHKSVIVAIKKNHNLISTAPVEKVRDELNNILLSSKPSRYLKIMVKTGLLDIILPELAKCIGVKQDKRYHKFDVFRHCIYACDNIKPDLILRLAAVLHDIGKPSTRKIIGKKTTFHKHEVVSARLARIVLERLRYKNEIISKVIQLIRLHMYYYTRDFTDAAVRRFIKRAGLVKKDINNLGDIPLFELRKAERKGNGFKTIPVTEKQLDFEKRIISVFKSSSGFEVGDLAINGNTIMKMFSMEASPKIGEVLNHLLNKVLDDPKVNKENELIKLAAEYIYYKM